MTTTTPAATATTITAPATSRSRSRIHVPYGLISIIGGLLTWELLVRLFNPSRLIIVAPSEILTRLWEMLVTGEIWPDLSVSMQGFVLGYILAALIAIPLGLIIGASSFVYRWTNVWVTALYATPIIGLAPLFIIIFGFGLQAKVAVVVALVIFPILINTVAGARAVDQSQRELAQVYRADRLETFVRVMFPGSIPFILTGLRLAIGRGLIGVVVADLFGASHGLGLHLQQSAQAFNTTDIFAVTVLLAILGITLTSILEYFEKRTSRGASS